MTTAKQPGFALWLTGLPSSGKTTLARAVSQRLAAQGSGAQLLDSDELRRKLTPQPSYSEAERDWFYGMIVFLAELLTNNGVNVIIAATAPLRAYREAARERLARFAEVYVVCPPEVCRARDPKGLWQKADAGEIKTLPGAGAAYEAPLSPELSVNTAEASVETAAAQIWRYLEEVVNPSGDLNGEEASVTEPPGGWANE
jgi:adenylylsulfate kinase